MQWQSSQLCPTFINVNKFKDFKASNFYIPVALRSLYGQNNNPFNPWHPIAVPDSWWQNLKWGWFPNQPSYWSRPGGQWARWLFVWRQGTPQFQAITTIFIHFPLYKLRILNCLFGRDILYPPFSDMPTCPGSGTSPSFDLREDSDMLPAVNTMQDVNVKDNLGRQKYWWQLSDSSLTGPHQWSRGCSVR